MGALEATNRTQRVVLGFFAVVWLALLLILLADPQIYDSTLKLGPGGNRLADVALLVAVSLLIATLVVGTFRRWRWVFWLILLAFLAGIVRLIASTLELAGAVAASGPSWYVAMQAVIGIAQIGIAVAMIAGYRKAGVWGAF
jgi:small-conductance mechanosensitive channel